MIPKFTAPEAKMIRTLEGIAVAIFGLAMVVVPIVTTALPAATATKWAAVVASATVIARSLAKGIMAWQTPMMPAAAPELDLSSNPPTGPTSMPAEVTPIEALRQQVIDLGGNPHA